MTIETTVLSSADAFSDDKVVRLQRTAFPDNLSLSATEWTVQRHHASSSFLEVLNFVFAQILERLKGYEIWLLTGDTAWQPDTRIVRYRKRFNALKVQGIDFEAIPERYESMVEHDGKLKFFGAVRLEASVIHLVPLTTTPRSCTYIVALPNPSDFRFPLSLGWSGQLNEDSRLVASIVDHGGIVFQRVGFFDDPQVGLVAVGSPPILARIAA
ncbi:hypothetical protein HDG34_004123 [Paraburkholderia sp. HC6.4b]|uniref:hypothetical protein n=1 Tax=unclassified Paraburkholderia TaxID=2615204 RepID=UPI00160CD9D0|nr:MULTISPECIES: hypothetical protein [unclassified Paraburkholderia]MBB5410170.1 hypothetical protein [Paraburkholderia sp. HC6.4b]MBB5452379.1 hypothetical protein [Paraburkholderia sp. Kb1A]